MKKIITLLAAIVLTFTACSPTPSPQKYNKYRYQFYDSFDTIIDLIAYTETEEDFNKYAELCQESFRELHLLYDRFNNYPNLNNVKTINDNAGIEPVKVDSRILELVKISKEWYEDTHGKVNIAIGPVTSVWHGYMESYNIDSTNSEIPERDKLEAAAEKANVNDIIVNEQDSTVYLAKNGMELDLGGVAKGYATEIVAKKLEEAGLTSFLLSAGGNVRAGGKPLDGQRERWGVGIQNPNDLTGGENSMLDIVFVKNSSVVTSGDYQRFYIYEGKRMHHIIDPDTLMPGDKYRGVSIVVPDSGLADMLSTALFLLDYDEGAELAEKMGAQALWILPDGEIKVTDSMKKIMKDMGGATGAKAE